MFGLAIHQHAQPKSLLLLHAVFDLGVHGALVVGEIQVTGLEFAACLADLCRLWERVDGGDREGWQLEQAGLLGGRAS